MNNTPWVVGVLIALFAGNSIFGIWLTERFRQKSTTADQKITDTGQALGGFKDLVTDLQEERASLRADIDELKAEIARLKRKERP